MKDTDTHTKWLTVPESSRRLARPLRQLLRVIDEGELAAFRVDGDLKLRAEDVGGYHETSQL